MANSTISPTAAALTTVTNVLTIANAAAPDILAIIAEFRNGAATLESLLADSDATEKADIAKIQSELGTPPATT